VIIITCLAVVYLDPITPQSIREDQGKSPD